MLAFARRQTGKPFSNYGMTMSILFPRECDEKTWFCAELVAAILREGGLMSADSNPSAATPHSLYKMYSKQAAATANPFVLRKFKSQGLTFNAMTEKEEPAQSLQIATHAVHAAHAAHAVHAANAANTANAANAPSSVGPRKRTESPPKASFRVIQQGSIQQGMPPLGLSFDSLRTVR